MGRSATNAAKVSIKEQASWGTAVLAAAFVDADWVDCEATAPATQPVERLTMETMRTNYAATPHVSGSRAGATVTLKMPLHGVEAATPVSDPAETVEATLLGAALGGLSITGYSAALTGGSSASDLTYSAGSDAWEGQAILVPLTGGGYGIGWVSDYDGGDLGLTQPLAALPLAGTALGSLTAYLRGGTASPLSLYYQGEDTNAAWIYSDGVVTSLKLEGQAKGIWTLEVTLQFLNWSRELAGGAPASAVYPTPRLAAAIGDNGTRVLIDGNSLCVGTVTFEVTTTVKESLCMGDAQGVAQFTVTKRETMLTLEGPETDFADVNLTATPTVQVDMANTPGAAGGILMPAAIYTANRELSDLGGELGYKLTFKGGGYAGDDTNGAASNSPARVALL